MEFEILRQTPNAERRTSNPKHKYKRVLVVGLARQGTALARFLVGEGAQVTITDIQPAEALSESLAALEGLPIRTALGGHPLSLLDDTDLVCLSGGVPTNIPLVAEVRRRGIPLSNDALLTLERSPAPVIGITGSSGKTTTATLVGLILEEADIPVHVGGNIGTPLIDRLDELQASDWAVMELSSFQLELFDRSPPVAAVTNVTPNHLDRHGTMAAYSAAKANILRWQTADDVCVLSADDEITGRWLRQGRVEVLTEDKQHTSNLEPPTFSFPIRAQRLGFSLREEMAAGAFLRGEDLVLRLPGRPEETICRREIIRLRGLHNVANLLAACLLAGLAGAPPQPMARVAASFEGVEHRLEIVRILHGVLWVNDSIATSPERAVAAITSFDEPIVLLAGGRDKKLPWDEFARRLHQRVKCVVLFGEAAALIEEAVREYGSGVEGKLPPSPHPLTLIRCADLEEAVGMAYDIAKPGDVVLLAPGGTSFDAYRDFAARGQHFHALVRAL